MTTGYRWQSTERQRCIQRMHLHLVRAFWSWFTRDEGEDWKAWAHAEMALTALKGATDQELLS